MLTKWILANETSLLLSSYSLKSKLDSPSQVVKSSQSTLCKSSSQCSECSLDPLIVDKDKCIGNVELLLQVGTIRGVEHHLVQWMRPSDVGDYEYTWESTHDLINQLGETVFNELASMAIDEKKDSPCTQNRKKDRQQQRLKDMPLGRGKNRARRTVRYA